MTEEETYQHLRDRGMVPELYSLGVGPGLVCFYLFDFMGKPVGYQQYLPFGPRNSKNVREARYFTYLPKRTNGYFGLESLAFDGPVYLVEGVFKAATLHRLGYASISLMGSETKQHRNQLAFLRRELVAIGDNDPAGHKFTRALGGFVSPTDLDEMEDEEVKELLNENHKSR